MAAIHPSRWIERGRRVLSLLGTFDAEAARELLAEIRGEPELEIVIDLVHVRHLDEVGLAALARLAHAGGGRRIALRGLTDRQHRILRHLGAGLSDLGA